MKVMSTKKILEHRNPHNVSCEDLIKAIKMARNRINNADHRESGYSCLIIANYIASIVRRDVCHTTLPTSDYAEAWIEKHRRWDDSDINCDGVAACVAGYVDMSEEIQDIAIAVTRYNMLTDMLKAFKKAEKKKRQLSKLAHM